MPKYNICISGTVTCYGDIEVDAENLEEAQAIADTVAQKGHLSELMPVLDPDWGSLDDFEVVDVQSSEELAQRRKGKGAPA